MTSDVARQTYYVGVFKVKEAAEECADNIRCFWEVGPQCGVEVIEDVALGDDRWWVIALRPEGAFQIEFMEHLRNFAEGFETGYRARMRAEKA